MKLTFLIAALFSLQTAIASTNQVHLSTNALFSSALLPNFTVEEDKAIDCSEEPGRTLCRKIRRYKSLLVTCQGAGCLDLWDDQLCIADELLDHYYDEIDPQTKFEAAVGEMAEQTARKLCRFRITGDATIVSRLVISYNQVVTALEEIQEASGIESPYSCEFTLD